MNGIALGLLISLMVILVSAAVLVPVFVWSWKKFRVRVLYEYNGHKIEIINKFYSTKLVVDGKLVDTSHRSPYERNSTLIYKMDEDVIRVNTGNYPEVIKLYINDEKQNINY